MMEKPLVTDAVAMYPYEKWIEKQFTCKSNFGDTYDLFRVSPCGEYIYVPRGVCPVGDKDKRIVGHDCGFESSIKPRDDEQKRIINECVDLLEQGITFTMRSPTGSGKGVMGLEIIKRVNKPTLVVVAKDDLMVQWTKNIHKFLKIPHSRVGVIQQDVCEYKNKWIVVAMLHSVSKEDRYPEDMYKHFGFIMIDEIARIPTNHLGTILELFPAYLRMGMSAKVKRKDGRDLYIESHIGPTLVESDQAPMDFKVVRYTSDWECPRWKTVVDGKVVMRRAPHTGIKCGHIINSIVKHVPTNNFWAWLIKAAYDKGRDVIFFSDRVEHLEQIMELAAKRGVPRKDMAFYVGTRIIDGKKKKMSRGEKERAKKKRIKLFHLLVSNNHCIFDNLYN